MISNIANNILSQLLEEGDYTTSQIIAANQNISTKTVYRAIAEIREVFGADIIESSKGKGYKLNFEVYIDNVNNLFVNKNNNGNYTRHRRALILYHLLLLAPEKISVKKLSEKYYVSESSITNDLDFIEEMLSDSNLLLQKENTGTSIQGSEVEIRKYLMKIVNENLIYNQSSILFNNINSESLELMTNEFSKESIQAIDDILSSCLEKNKYLVENPYYTNLLTHLVIMLKRYDKADYEMNWQEINEFKKVEYELAKEIINKIERKFGINIRDVEISYVYAFLVSSRKVINRSIIQNEENDIKIKPNASTAKIVNEIIYKMEVETGVPFSKEITLKRSLLLHIQPLLNRLKYGVIIINPIIKEIKLEYKNIFQTLKKIIKNIKTNNICNLTDDEIGFISIYFQNTIEKLVATFNVLIVCNTGIGTSHLLKTRVINHFPTLKIIDVLSTDEIANYECQEVDFILTTVKLPEVGVPQLLVSALLDKKDINLINEFMLNMKGR
ncbi:PRD domain-containing protein [Facklamia sp. DSM 111018]|uniref:PRD domain-containing protein n=1 Tax=Facklamia lactis TaxID=2749967 RepID=A0ABS0LQD6_9LACT|nr:PRD domain-containing protein [Facklamia lactis]MBG9986361.1 PRD domain-containing protein [Facklamia lactis]